MKTSLQIKLWVKTQSYMHRIFLEGYKRLETVTASGENLVTESQHDSKSHWLHMVRFPSFYQLCVHNPGTLQNVHTVWASSLWFWQNSLNCMNAAQIQVTNCIKHTVWETVSWPSSAHDIGRALKERHFREIRLERISFVMLLGTYRQ